MLLLCERHIKDKNKLPLIVPLILYTGVKQYDAPKNLWQLFTVPELAKDLMCNDYKVIDLQAMSDEEIKKKKHLGMMEYFLKHIQQRDMLKLWEEFLKDFQEMIVLDKESGYIYIKTFLWYTDTKVSEDRQQELNDLIVRNLEGGEDIMRSIAQKYIDEGLQQGAQQGIEKGATKKALEIAINMIKQNFDFKIIAQVTGLSNDQIQKIKY